MPTRNVRGLNEFARVVAEEYLRFFDFTGRPLDAALRMFLHRFCLIGETQERERVLVHFSKRYLDCNPGAFKSQDAVHTLTCALMLLNTDLHSENVGHKMTCLEFIENLAELNEGENFPKEVLKALYLSIKTAPLEWAVYGDLSQFFFAHTVPNPNCATEYKKGYVMRKCCLDPGGKRIGSQKRFQRPLLPVSHTKFNLREQLTDHENRIVWLEKELEEHVANAPEKGAKSRTVAEFVEKESFLQNELKRYRTYAYLLRSKMAQYPELVPALVETSIGEVDEPEQNHGGSHGCANNPLPPSPSRTKQPAPSHKTLPSSPALGSPSPAFSAPAVASSCSPRSSPTAARTKRIAQDRYSYRTAVQKGGDLGT
ncbi:hypothetical protein HPB50_005896 [Hyalomma asiaticum]|uniref:Uncharacterized protein n=1 Tax=Hyalomma asiaticum TaxID=266040 RepID=A0ACB7TFI3_HYAAI|nr:hypothetical protein HPB50_005896 [Hyalomma asiaticum]